MGTISTKDDPIPEIFYISTTYPATIHFSIHDDFPYPRKPKANDILKQFEDVLKTCILTEFQTSELNSLSNEIKWKLICKHRYFLLTSNEKLPIVKEKKKSEILVDLIKKSDSLSDIDKLYQWIINEAKEEEINEFIKLDGLKMLINILKQTELCSRVTQNSSKQLLLLKILNHLMDYPQIISHLINIPDSIMIIFLNYNQNQLLLDKFVLEILNTFCWESPKGTTMVLEAMDRYKKEFSGNSRFEPLIKMLRETNNVIMLENLVPFINTIIDSINDEQKRSLIRSELVSSGVKDVFKEIKDKIHQNKLKVEDSTYENYVKLKEENESLKFHSQKNYPEPSSTIFLDNDPDSFQQKLNNILKQIEIFENGFIEYIEEIDIDYDDNSPKRISKKSTIDFTDVDQIYNKMKERSLSKGNYESFVKIMQQLCLLGNNDKSKKVINIMIEGLNQFNGNSKSDSILNLTQFEKLMKKTENNEDLERKLIFLDTQLKIRDDEIRELRKGKLNIEIKLNGIKKEIDKAEKNLCFQAELNKSLESKLLRDDRKLSKLIQEKDNKLKTNEIIRKDLNLVISNSNSPKKYDFNKSFDISSKNNESFLTDKKYEELELENKKLKLKLDNLEKLIKDQNPIKEIKTTNNILNKEKSTSPDQKKNLNEIKDIKKIEFNENSKKSDFFENNKNNDVLSNNNFNLKRDDSNKIRKVNFQAEIISNDIELSLNKYENISNVKNEIENENLNLKKSQSKEKNIYSKSQSIDKNISSNEKNTSTKFSSNANQNIENSFLNDSPQLFISQNQGSQGLPNQLNHSNNNDLIIKERQQNENKSNQNQEKHEDIIESNNDSNKKMTQSGKKSIKTSQILDCYSNDPNLQSIYYQPILVEKSSDSKRSSIPEKSLNKKKNSISENPLSKQNTSEKIENNEIKKQNSSEIPKKENCSKSDVSSPQNPNDEKKKSIISISPPPPVFLPPPPPPPMLPPNLLKNILPPNLNLLSSLMKQTGPIKQKKKPNVPMKSVMWTLVNGTRVQGTIWENIEEEKVLIDYQELENEFTTIKAEKPIQEIKKIEKISLLTSARSQNFNIIMTKLKLSPSSIIDAVITMRQDILTLNTVNSLLDAIPTNDEIALISNYNGDFNLLEAPERYILEIKEIKGFKIRLLAYQFFLTHKELTDDLELKIEKLLSLMNTIRNEDRIKLLMKYTLAIGNYMNGESARGGAFGFKLDIFEKIMEVKNSQGKKSLITYIIEIIEKNTESDFISVDEEFALYDFGRKLPISQLFIDLGLINKGLQLINEAKQIKICESDKIEEVFGKFSEELYIKIKILEERTNTLNENFKKICMFYCEDEKELNSDEFVDRFYRIWACCKKAKALIIKEKKEKKIKEKEREKDREKDREKEKDNDKEINKAQEKEEPAKNRISIDNELQMKNNAAFKLNNPTQLAKSIKNLRLSRGPNNLKGIDLTTKHNE